MMIFQDIIFVLCAYIIGSLPHLRALGSVRNVKLDGDYHQSLWQKGGKFAAVIGILTEFIKGALPVMAGYFIGFDLSVIAVGGLAVVCGQMWPVFQKFDGEKGNTIGLGMAAALDYLPLLFGLIPIAAGAAIRTASRISAGGTQKVAVIGGPYSRVLPVAMMIGFLVLPLAAWYLNRPPEIVLAFSALFILILVRRFTAGLKRDLQSGIPVNKVLRDRFLYDRSACRYRVPDP